MWISKRKLEELLKVSYEEGHNNVLKAVYDREHALTAPPPKPKPLPRFI